MHSADIRAALIKKGYNQAMIAEQVDCSPANVSQVVNGVISSRKVAELISNVIGKPLDELWPGRYSQDTKLPKIRRRA